MAAIRTTANMIRNEILMLHHRPLSSSCSSLSLSSIQTRLPGFRGSTTLRFTQHRGINFGGTRYAASDSGSDDKVSARFSQVKQLLREAEERASSAGNEPIPKITLGTSKLLMPAFTLIRGFFKLEQVSQSNVVDSYVTY